MELCILQWGADKWRRCQLLIKCLDLESHEKESISEESVLNDDLTEPNQSRPNPKDVSE